MRTTEAVFRALASPVRREILHILRQSELTAGEIGEHFDITGPSVSRHLAVLKAAELVVDERQGNTIIYRLEPERLANTVGDFLSAVCPTQAMARRSRGNENDETEPQT
jgi:DNA-binding transcriptional ArsR family regulator